MATAQSANDSVSDLDDRHYFSELARGEADYIFSTIQPLVGESESRAAFERLAESLGEAVARIDIIEQALALRLADADPFRHGPLLVGRQRLAATELAGQLDCHPIQQDAAGRDYAWTKTPTLEVQLAANRCRKKFARLWFKAIVQPHYARSLQVSVDGVEKSYALLAADDQYAIEWVLPKSEDLVASNIQIVLPGVHKPADLGTSDDRRELGIAVTALEFDDCSRRSVLSRLKSRLLKGH